MIQQDIYLSAYDWHVHVYYAVTTYWHDRILCALRRAGCRGVELKRASRNLSAGRLDTGLTYSNFGRGETVMVIGLTSSPDEFLNSWLHEMRHLSRHIEQAYQLSPYGEAAAYLAGNIGQRMFPVAKDFLCVHCRNHLIAER